MMSSEKINDLDLEHWKDIDDVFTDSLWIIPSRDKTGVHNRNYHGAFVPQIVHQVLRRYTKPGDFVLDPFAGSGTTLIEAQRLDRNSVGIDLLKDVVEEANRLVSLEHKDGIVSEELVANSLTFDFGSLLEKYGINSFQSIIYHPPYWDIIKFSDKKSDLSDSPNLANFLKRFRKVVHNTIPYLQKGRYCALVIGDKYSNGQLIPLSSYCMEVMQKEGLTLKTIAVKNIEETKGKSGSISLWKYRSLVGGYYVFKHEYIYIFQKTK